MKIAVFSIHVDDQQKALDFYTEKLGFQKKHDIPVGDARWLTVVDPANPDDTEISLEPLGMPEVRDKLVAYRESLVSNGIPWTSFGTEDIQAEHERLRKAGVEFVQGPTEMGPVTIAVLDDTCGNLIQIAEQREGV